MKALLEEMLLYKHRLVYDTNLPIIRQNGEHKLEL